MDYWNLIRLIDGAIWIDIGIIKNYLKLCGFVGITPLNQNADCSYGYCGWPIWLGLGTVHDG